MEDNNVEEYLRNAQETKRQSIIEDKREDHPPPLPPRYYWTVLEMMNRKVIYTH